MNTTKIPEHFKQEGPHQQLTCIVMALEGGISNLQEGIPVNLNNLLERIEDLREIQSYLPKTWRRE